MNHWSNFIGATEEQEHYSDALMKDDSFLDIVKASTHTPGIREWFEKIILCENDNKFDELCQNINQKILEKLIDTAKDRKMKLTDQAKSKVSFNIKIFEMCQHPLLEGLIDNSTTFEQRTGVVCIIQILRDRIEIKQQKGLLSYVQLRNKEMNLSQKSGLKNCQIKQCFF